MRRPTTRFANCTGMRRWPSSTYTTATMMNNVSATIAVNQNHLLSCKMPQKPPGNEATTEAKMIIDMPLPMPRWLISSAIHISTAVPAISVGMIR